MPIVTEVICEAIRILSLRTLTSSCVNNCHSNDGCPTNDLLSSPTVQLMAPKLRSFRLFRMCMDWQRECFSSRGVTRTVKGLANRLQLTTHRESENIDGLPKHKARQKVLRQNF
jgi:hypothetical protein